MRRVVLFSMILLAACGQKSAANSNEETSAVNQIVPTNSVNETSAVNQTANGAQANEGEENETEAKNVLGALPPADAALRFVGLWATSEANCTSRPWRFTPDSLAAADGPNCSIYKVAKAPGGYDLAARCPGKKPVELDLIKLRFAESARAMLVESNAIKPTGLIYCGK